MSGFLPDIASWALRGAAGSGGDENGDEEPNNGAGDEPEAQTLTDGEIRARRLARISGGMPEPQEDANNPANMPVPMEVEEDRKPAAKTITSKEALEVPKQSTPKPPSPAPEPSPKKKKPLPSPLDSTRKLQKKKELLLKKVLQIVLPQACISGDSLSVVVDVDTSEINVQTVAEIIASRLSMTSLASSHNKGIIPYLSSCHKRAADEIKVMKQQKESRQIPELEKIAEEIKSQAVSYAASSLMVPDLFESGKDGAVQLARCLLATSTDIGSSITFGVSGKDSSFYYCLCEEILSQDKEAFDSIIWKVVDYLTAALSKVNTVLDSGTDGAEGGGLVVVSALCALCSHKKAALALTQMTNFILPAPNTPSAQERVAMPPPALPPGASQQQRQLFRIMQAMGRNSQGYLKRSGPALEKETIMGLILRLGCPRDDPSVTAAFPNVMANLDSVEKTADHQRRQLIVYQDTCNNLIRSLVTAGPAARQRVMQWIMDALLVNIGATAMRPDTAKVSKPTTLINISVALLKLCEPFMENDAKAGLIDPGFVSSPSDHGGVFALSGDESVPRLGENNSEASYNPKNSFIPQCFFFAARSLHLGIVPFSAFYLNLLRNINHVHHEIRQRNGDLQTDPNFNHLVSMQRAVEVTIFLEDMIGATLRFCNLMANFLLRLDGSQLGLMPEHFVDDICEILLFLAKVTRIKPKLMQGHDYGSIFRMVVKLLSPESANVSNF